MPPPRTRPRPVLRPAAAVLAVLALAACGGGDPDGDTDCGSVAKAGCTPVVGVGKGATVSRLTVRAKSVRSLPAIRDRITGKPGRGSFVVVTVTVTSTRPDRELLSDQLFRLRADGKTYEPSSASSYLISPKRAISGREVSRNEVITGDVLFNVPTSAVGGRLAIRFSDLELGKGYATVRLPKPTRGQLAPQGPS